MASPEEVEFLKCAQYRTVLKYCNMSDFPLLNNFNINFALLYFKAMAVTLSLTFDPVLMSLYPARILLYAQS